MFYNTKLLWKSCKILCLRVKTISYHAKFCRTADSMLVLVPLLRQQECSAALNSPDRCSRVGTVSIKQIILCGPWQSRGFPSFSQNSEWWGKNRVDVGAAINCCYKAKKTQRQSLTWLQVQSCCCCFLSYPQALSFISLRDAEKSSSMWSHAMQLSFPVWWRKSLECRPGRLGYKEKQEAKQISQRVIRWWGSELGTPHNMLSNFTRTGYVTLHRVHANTSKTLCFI